MKKLISNKKIVKKMRKTITLILLSLFITNSSKSEILFQQKETKCISFIKKYNRFEENILQKIEKFNITNETNEEEKIKLAFFIFNSFSDLTFSFSTAKNDCLILNNEELIFIENNIKNKKFLANKIFLFILNNRKNI